jgi:hypothetical protein
MTWYSLFSKGCRWRSNRLLCSSVRLSPTSSRLGTLTDCPLRRPTGVPIVYPRFHIAEHVLQTKLNPLNLLSRSSAVNLGGFSNKVRNTIVDRHNIRAKAVGSANASLTADLNFWMISMIIGAPRATRRRETTSSKDCKILPFATDIELRFCRGELSVPLSIHRADRWFTVMFTAPQL